MTSATEADVAGPEPAPALCADPFTSALTKPDLAERLWKSSVSKYMRDPGFLNELERLQALAQTASNHASDFMATAEVSQKIAQAGHKDPRIMQALMVLQGQDLIVEDADIKKAESFGDIKQVEPVTPHEFNAAKDLVDPEECKTKGNEFFKAEKFAYALAHYDKGVTIIKEQKQAKAVLLATLLSNRAMVYLKLKFPDRAKEDTSTAIAVVRHVGDEAFDQAKLFYRRALAEEALKEFSMAVDDMTRAFQQAKKSAASPAEQHRLRAEVDRLKKLKNGDEELKEKRKKEKENERSAEVVRMQGSELDEKKKTAVVAPPVDASYLQTQDFTFLAKKRIAEVVRDLVHCGGSGCKITTTELHESSKVDAQIVTKRGKRSLYYSMDLHVQWNATAGPRLRPSDGKDEMKGVIRVYNIAHDTKFELGGDENTSYIYSLGWSNPADTSPWVMDIRAEAAELFDLVAAKVDQVIAELKKK